MSANSGSRLSRFGTSFIHRAPAVLAFCFAIAAVPFSVHGAETTIATNDTRPDVVAAELAALRHRLFHAEIVWGKATPDEDGFKSSRAKFEQEVRDALPQLERYLGPYHSEVLQWYRWLAIGLMEQGRYQEALGFAKTEYERWKKARGVFDLHTKQAKKRGQRVGAETERDTGRD